MNKEAEIVSYLREKYRPVGIILHGSRAIGKSRPHSDWDIFLLFIETPKQVFNREEIAGEDVEWKAFRVPIAHDSILDVFGVQLQFSKNIWESENAATHLLEQATDFYSRGVSLTDTDRSMYKQYLIHKVYGMEDDIDTPHMFLRHQYAFFERASNWWFEMHKEYRKPFYVAMESIKDRDPEYHSLLTTVCGSGTNKEKINAAKTIVSRLFST